MKLFKFIISRVFFKNILYIVFFTLLVAFIIFLGDFLDLLDFLVLLDFFLLDFLDLLDPEDSLDSLDSMDFVDSMVSTASEASLDSMDSNPLIPQGFHSHDSTARTPLPGFHSLDSTSKIPHQMMLLKHCLGSFARVMFFKKTTTHRSQTRLIGGWQCTIKQGMYTLPVFYLRPMHHIKIDRQRLGC